MFDNSFQTFFKSNFSTINKDPNNTEEPVFDEAEAQKVVDDLMESLDNAEPGNAEGQSEPVAEEVDEVTALRSQLAEMEKVALRHQADLENFRKRSRAQVQDQLKYASLPLITQILEAVDNLNRATEVANDESADAAGIVEGVKMVSQQLSNILEQQGCKRIEAVGKPFDPNCHQAVQMQPSDEFESNTVMTEVRAGFMLHDRVIRPAQVFVSTGPAT